jgi:hypothetical protein
MNLKAGIYSLLTANAGLSALIGTRVYPIMLPEAPTLPAIRFQYVGGSSEPTFDTSGMQKLRVQFDCMGADPDSADAVRTAMYGLNGYSGLLSDGTLLQNFDLLGPGIDFFDSDARQFRCMVEFYLWFNFAD